MTLLPLLSISLLLAYFFYLNKLKSHSILLGIHSDISGRSRNLRRGVQILACVKCVHIMFIKCPLHDHSPVPFAYIKILNYNLIQY